MKALGWIVVGVGLGAALVYLVANAPEPAYGSGDPDVDRAADKTAFWGAKTRAEGLGGGLLGQAKQAVGEATGNESLADSGAGDQAIGAIKDTVGKAANAISDTVHDLNR